MPGELIYLFHIDEDAYFLSSACIDLPSLHWLALKQLRELKPNVLALAGITAVQLKRWRQSRQFCGVCGCRMQDSERERARVCPQCGSIEYPVISPCVITALIDRRQNKLLVVQGHTTSRRMALIAGYVEIGETLEQAVIREVAEEVGLRVKKSALLRISALGVFFHADDGVCQRAGRQSAADAAEAEIADARWMAPEEIPENPDPLSIGHQMIERFRQRRL